jgi:phosphoribosylanthranilate isomerase
MIWVKICGTTNLDDAMLAVDSGADAVGFVFAPHSKRHVTAQQVAVIARELPETVEKVGVFANMSWSDIRDTYRESGIDTLQLYLGSELLDHTPQDFPEMENGKPKMIVAIALPELGETGGFLLKRREGEDNVRVLFDSGSQKYGGGTGDAWDWAAAHPFIQHFKEQFPVIVAGGLNPSNVTSAIEMLHPWGVDVVSGVEREPGKKDPDKVRAFINAVRRADEKNSGQ